MDMDTDINGANDEKLQVEETDDSCIVDFIEIVPLASDNDGSCTTECMDLAINAVNEEHLQVEETEHLHVKETDDSRIVDFIEIVPLTGDTDGSSVMECVSRGPSAEVKEVDLADLQQELDDDYESSAMYKNEADVDETLSHMRPVVPETLKLARLQKKYHICINSGESSLKVKTEVDSSDHTEHPHDDKPRPYLCTTKNSLTVDQKQQTGGNWYSCTECGKRYSSTGALCNHMNIHRGKYKCTECGRCCGSKYILAVHKRSHSGEKPFECTVCSKRCASSSDLAAHSKVHSGYRPFICHVCGKAFSRCPDLTAHVRIHSGEKLYKCHMCDKMFSHGTHLKNHMSVHTGYKPFQCYECGQAFSQAGNLKVHMRVHTGEKPYKCSMCNKTFSRSGHLQRHKRSVHRNTADEL